MSPSAPSQTNSDAVLADIVEEFTNRLQAGEAVDAESYAQRHPEHAERIRQLLPALAVLAEVGHSADIDSAGAPRDAAEDALSGTLGDFRLLREVGRGGMGIVYEAEQISLKRRVALKVLPFAATMDPRHLQRFHNEAQAAACLHHTNIVPVFSVGCERGVHFYAMQFIEGQPLSDVIRQRQEAEKKTPAAAGEVQTAAHQPSVGDGTPRPVADLTPLTGEGRRGRDYFRKVAELGVQAAEALDHAHQLGIVHRDIKPANLLLDARGNLWVTDFGLAHIQHGEGNLTMTGQALGTPRYMSPEQALAQRVPIDHRTDVYSLGATLYELLTLRPAFASEDRQELLRQIASEEPAAPRRLERAIPAELEIIVLKAMEKRPQDRYATAQELADDLRRWLLDQPIRARRSGLLARAQKWSRRHKPLVRALGLGLAVAVVALAASTAWAWHKERQAQDARQYADQQRVAAENNAEEAGKQRRQALENFRKAVKVVTGLLNQARVAHRHEVSPRAGDLSASERTRLSLANQAIGIIEELLKAETPTEPEGRLLTAQAYEGLGTAHLIRGELIEAAQNYVRARDLCGQLATEFPGEAHYEAEKLRIHTEMRGLRPLLLAQEEADKGMHEVAARAFRDCLQINQVIGVEINGNITLSEQTFCRLKLADALRALGRRQEAEQVYGEALLSCDELAKYPAKRVYPTLVVVYRARGQASRGLLRSEDGRLKEAETDLRQALDLVDGLKPGEQQIAGMMLNDRARIRSALGNVLWAAGRRREAAEQFRAAEQEWRKGPRDPVRVNQLAWFLVSCPDTQFRNAKDAVALAREAVKGIRDTEPWITLGVVDRNPWDCRRTLGVALYRTGDWKGALGVLQAAWNLKLKCRAAVDGFDMIFQGMAFWQLTDKDRGRRCYDNAVDWMKKNRPRDPELHRLREEAAQLLGIEATHD